MKAIILAGGYATRLMPLTKHIPKPLLPVAGKPVIDYTIEKLNQVAEIDGIIVTTNKVYESNFKYWLQCHPQNPKNIKIVSDNTKTEKEKLGAVATLQFIIQSQELDDQELLVIAGDNIFEFSLNEFVNYYRKYNQPVIAVCDLANKDKNELKRYGLAIMDDQQKVIGFQEKPQNPQSSRVATGCYIYPRDIQKYLTAYLADKNNPDAPGYFVEWLHKRVDVYGFVPAKTWYDIGSMESYDQVNDYFKNKLLPNEYA